MCQNINAIIAAGLCNFHLFITIGPQSIRTQVLKIMAFHAIAPLHRGDLARNLRLRFDNFRYQWLCWSFFCRGRRRFRHRGAYRRCRAAIDLNTFGCGGRFGHLRCFGLCIWRQHHPRLGPLIRANNFCLFQLVQNMGRAGIPQIAAPLQKAGGGITCLNHALPCVLIHGVWPFVALHPAGFPHKIVIIVVPSCHGSDQGFNFFVGQFFSLHPHRVCIVNGRE